MATKTTSKNTYNSRTARQTTSKKKVKKETLFDKISKFEVKQFFKGETLQFGFGVVVLAISLFMILSFVSHFLFGAEEQTAYQAHEYDKILNYGGVLGAHVARYFMDRLYGLAAIFIPIFLIATSVKLMNAYKVRLWKWFLNCTFLMFWVSLFFSQTEKYFDFSWFIFPTGGEYGKEIRDGIAIWTGNPGLWIIIAVSAIFYLTYLSRETINIFRKLLHPQDFIKKGLDKYKKDEEDLDSDDLEEDTEVNFIPEDDVDIEEEEHTEYEDTSTYKITMSTDEEDVDDTTLTIADNEVENDEETTLILEETFEVEKADGIVLESVENLEPYDPRKDLENYKFPKLDLLKKYTDNSPAIDMEEQNTNKNRIIAVLKSFGVEISSISATIGPTITLYEITPAAGVRISKIRNLEDDIALSLSALGIRIIAPIPGKGTIGIEVPNKNPRIVSMESILNSKKFQETTYDLPIALGKTITNDVYMVDLAKMPHLLVAGATGQGKSVGLNAIITSLLYKKHPAELKFVMVDPKKVEFSVYSPLENHFLAMIPQENDPIITDVTKVVQTLKSLCQLMDHRYDLLKKARVRNIKEYNAKFISRQLNPENGHEYMPYIVVIIDEFGDLIMTAGKEVELPIARIAQLARAVGMHMVIATQRPTTNIITGTIKANFPARMAFKVMSQIDSRTILDRNGANQLVGRGDMLFLAGNDPVRVQCAFVDTPEVEKINDHICKQQSYLSAFELPEPLSDTDTEGSIKEGLDASEMDPMFAEAARLIVIHQQGSTSLIQRKFSIGYNRAGRLMDQMERAGIVGPTRGAKPREVLCADENELEMKLNSL